MTEWDYQLCLYTQTHCTARGLREKSIAAYFTSLKQFRGFAMDRNKVVAPAHVTPRIVLDYITHLRKERNNGDSIVSRAVTILKGFYRAMVAMGHIEPEANPMAHFPKMKCVPRKLPRVLSDQDVARLVSQPPTDTILGLRDRAMMLLLCGSGIRASECAQLTNGDVDLEQGRIRVTGKGGHERVVPIHARVVEALRAYRNARGIRSSDSPFFLSRTGKSMSRGAVYERVRTVARRAGIERPASPHQLRHTFATQMLKAGREAAEIRDTLGHRCISSTQIYMHVTAQDLREAADTHPIGRLAPIIESILPGTKLRFQDPPRKRRPNQRA